MTATIKRLFWMKLTLAFFMLSSMQVMAANRILDNNEIELADADTLSSEAEVFKSIGLGIALSLANCADQQDCDLNVNRDEIQQLLDTLNDRIDGLVVRQESGEGDFTEVLTAYVNERENYLRYLDQVGVPGEEEDMEMEATISEPQPVEEPAGEVATGTSEEKFDVFEDVGEGIIEDEVIEDELPYDESEDQ